MPLFLFPVRLKIYIYQKLNISQMGWWMHPWRTLSVFVMEKMIILGPSHLRHWHKSWATPSRLWSPTCGHPVILLYRRLRMQVRYTHIFFFFFLHSLHFHTQHQYLFCFYFLFNRSHPGVAVKNEGTLLPSYNTSEFQTSSWYSLLCPVLRYRQHYTTSFKSCFWNVKLLIL